MSVDLRMGRWQDVLADVEAVDALICDPPYSERTHAGQSDLRRDFAYQPWTPADVRAFVEHWSSRCSGWIVCLTDDTLAPVFRKAYDDAGRCSFAAIPLLSHVPRLTGDGPSSSTVWLLVSRPRQARFLSWGSLPGWYQYNRVKNSDVLGAKPLDLMRALVRDYSRPLDTIVDPCAGGATTLLAAAMEGRRAIGAEMDPDTYAKAQKRLAGGWTPPLFAEETAPAEPLRLWEGGMG